MVFGFVGFKLKLAIRLKNQQILSRLGVLFGSDYFKQTPVFDKIEQFILEKIKAGFYSSASEVVREALRLLAELDSHKRFRVEQLNREIDLGLKDLAEYPSIASEEVFSQIRQKSSARRKRAGK